MLEAISTSLNAGKNVPESCLLYTSILFDNGQYFVRDNQSRNGTTVNGKAILPLQPVALKDGDEIRLYDEVLVFHLG